MAERLLLIDDDARLREIVCACLGEERFFIEAAADGARGLEKAIGGNYDLVILDISLPSISGIDVCRKLRARGSRVPILMLTGKTNVEDRVRGLESGADDYLGKPFSLKELVARVRALLRRRGEAVTEGKMATGDLELDPETRVAQVGNRRVALTARESDLLAALMERPGRVLSRSIIQERVWGGRSPASSNRVDVTVGRIRRKLDPSKPDRFIRTFRGIGYGLVV